MATLTLDTGALNVVRETDKLRVVFKRRKGTPEMLEKTDTSESSREEGTEEGGKVTLTKYAVSE